MTRLSIDSGNIIRYLGAVVEPGQVVELRIVGVVDNPEFPAFTVGGYFDHDHFGDLAKSALAWTHKAEGVYLTMNKVNSALLARAANRVMKKPKKLTSGDDIMARSALVIDCDPVRRAGISATEAEKVQARTVCEMVYRHLASLDWPDPIWIDSGNGYHLRYKINLPADDGGLVERVLKALDARFSTDGVKIDTTLFDRPRISKLPDTMARKGDSTPDRPHRWSGVLTYPDTFEVVAGDLLEDLAKEAPAETPPLRATKAEARTTKKNSPPRRHREGISPIDDFENRASWEDLLTPHDWKVDRVIGGETRWVRPGKNGGTSATTGHNKGFHVFSGEAAPFKANENYSKFQAHALLNHGGDTTVAVKALVAAGYGTWLDDDGNQHPNPAPPKPRNHSSSSEGVGNTWAATPGYNGKHDGNPVDASVQASEEPASPPIPAWPDPPEDAAFHEIAGEIVRLIAPSTEADPAGLLLQLLIGFGNAVGRGAWVEADGARHHANENVCCVGNTSRARKGTSEKRVRPILAYAEPGWAAKKLAHGLSSGEGLIWEIRDPILGTDKKTGQPVVVDSGVDDKRVLVIESEFGNVLRVLSRDGSTLSAVLRLAWDGDDLRTMTKNSPARATAPHVSLIGHITAQELAKYLTAVEVFNGLGNRFLWACVRRANVLPFGGSCDQAELARMGKLLAAAVDQARTLGQMGWVPSGRKLWEDEYGRLTEDRPGLWGAITSRGEAHVLRLALVFTLLDMGTEIEDSHVQAALALWRFCDRSATYLFGESVGDRDADAILAALRASPEGLTRTDINAAVFNRNRTSGDITRALGLLHRYGMALSDTIQTDGRDAERWRATNQEYAATKETNLTKEAPLSPDLCSSSSSNSSSSTRKVFEL